MGENLLIKVEHKNIEWSVMITNHPNPYILYAFTVVYSTIVP